MPEEKQKKLLTQQQFQSVFGYELGEVQRLLKFGLPHEIFSGKKYYDLIHVGQWLRSHWMAGYRSLEQMAELFGVEPRTITKFVNEFGMPKVANGLYRIKDCVQWREKYLNKKIKEILAGGEGGLSARQRLNKAKAIREEYKQALDERTLIRIDEVMPVFEEALKIMKQRLTVLPRRAAPMMEGTETNAEREEILRNNINEILTELAGTPDALRSVAESAREHFAESISDVEPAQKNDSNRVGRRKSANGKRKRSARTGKISKRSRTVSK
ncbi:MAG: hypothetical protein H3C35_03655 [Bacteroidetes bacterium]|nr:hypothetical protein [Bacteroidota bacterium]